MKRILISLIFFLSVSYAASEPVTDVVRNSMKELVDASEITEVLATGSMKPTFDENYWLILGKRPFHQLKPGDVIIYHKKDPTEVDGKKYYRVCHRIYSISSPKGEFIVTKGDNNRYADSVLVTEDMYDSIVVGWIRKDVVIKCVAL